MTEFEMMKKIVERLSNEIAWDIKGNTIYIDYVLFEFDEEGKIIRIE